MKQYYVIDNDNEDFDLDTEPTYRTHEEAKVEKERLEKAYPGTKYTIWEVD